MKKLSSFAGLLAGIVLLSGVAFGEILEMAPSRAVVLPSDESGKTRIAFYFDLSGLASGEGRIIGSAWMEWRLSGASEEDEMDFEASAVTESWTEESAMVSPTAVTIDEDPAAFWDITVAENERRGPGYVRIDLQDLASAWAAGSDNNGFVVSSPDIGGLSLNGQLDSARLIIRYGFIR